MKSLKVWSKYWNGWFQSAPAWTGLNIHRQSEYSCLQAWRNLSCVCSLHCRNPISQFSLQNCSEEFLWYRINPAFDIKVGGTPSSLLLVSSQMSLPTMEIYRAFIVVPPLDFNFYFNGSFCISRESIYIHQIVGLVLDRTLFVDFCLKVTG